MPSLVSAATVLASLAFSAVSVSAFDAAASSNLAVYWGQGNGQKSLGSFCSDATIDIIPIGFVDVFPDEAVSNGYPGTNFGNACGGFYTTAGGQTTQLLASCPGIEADIITCQANGKKILLSIGGGAATGAYLASDTTAVAFADFLWGAFGPVTDEWTTAGNPRPFGSAVVDGFDFDIESLAADIPTAIDFGYATMANEFRSLFGSCADKTQTFYLSAAPQCIVSDGHLADAISNAVFDFLFVQFYNTPQCSARAHFDSTYGQSANGGVPTDISYDTWITWVLGNSANKATKVYIGLPASTTAAGDAAFYLSPIEAQALITDFQCKYPANFGGIMLWEATYSDDNQINGQSYAQVIKPLLTSNSCGLPQTSSATTSSTTTSSTTTSTTSSTTSTTSTTLSTSTTSTTWTSSDSSSTTSPTSSSTWTSSDSSSTTSPTSSSTWTSSDSSSTTSPASSSTWTSSDSSSTTSPTSSSTWTSSYSSSTTSPTSSSTASSSTSSSSSSSVTSSSSSTFSTPTSWSTGTDTSANPTQTSSSSSSSTSSTSSTTWSSWSADPSNSSSSSSSSTLNSTWTITWPTSSSISTSTTSTSVVSLVTMTIVPVPSSVWYASTYSRPSSIPLSSLSLPSTAFAAPSPSSSGKSSSSSTTVKSADGASVSSWPPASPISASAASTSPVTWKSSSTTTPVLPAVTMTTVSVAQGATWSSDPSLTLSTNKVQATNAAPVAPFTGAAAGRVGGGMDVGGVWAVMGFLGLVGALVL